MNPDQSDMNCTLYTHVETQSGICVCVCVCAPNKHFRGEYTVQYADMMPQ